MKDRVDLDLDKARPEIWVRFQSMMTRSVHIKSYRGFLSGKVPRKWFSSMARYPC